jgi:hypothetical protein
MTLEVKKEKFKREGFTTGFDFFSEVRSRSSNRSKNLSSKSVCVASRDQKMQQQKQQEALCHTSIRAAATTSGAPQEVGACISCPSSIWVQVHIKAFPLAVLHVQSNRLEDRAVRSPSVCSASQHTPYPE